MAELRVVESSVPMANGEFIRAVYRRESDRAAREREECLAALFAWAFWVGLSVAIMLMMGME